MTAGPDRSFGRFFAARCLSMAGTTVTIVALPVLIFQLTGSPAHTALLTAIEVLPYPAFALIAGQRADRADRRVVMITCDTLNALALASIPLAVLLGRLTVAHVYLVAIVSATLFVWFDASNFGALLTLVGRRRLVAATSAIASAEQALLAAGPAAGGVLIAMVGPASALWIDAASYLASALLLASISAPFQHWPEAADQPGAARSRVRADLREGLQFLWGTPLIRTITLLEAGATFTSGATFSLLVVYGVQALGLSDDDARLGLLYAAIGVGSLAATLLLPRLARRVAATRITLAALPVTAVAYIAVALAPVFAVALVSLVVWRAAYTLVLVNGLTVRQLLTPTRLQGRVGAAGRALAWGGYPLGAATGGLLAQIMTVRPALLLTSIGVATSALLSWRSPLRASLESAGRSPGSSGVGRPAAGLSQIDRLRPPTGRRRSVSP